MRNEVIHGILLGLALVVLFVSAGSMIARPLSHAPPGEQTHEAPADDEQTGDQEAAEPDQAE
jgi:hypothetical protein